MLALGVEVRRGGDVSLLAHALDDLLDQLFELRSGIRLIAVRRVAEELLNRFLRQHAAVEERVEDRVVQRLHGPVVVVRRVGAAESARQQQVGQLRDQILEIQLVERVAGESRVAVFHDVLIPELTNSQSLVVILFLLPGSPDLFLDGLVLAARAAGAPQARCRPAYPRSSLRLIFFCAYRPSRMKSIAEAIDRRGRARADPACLISSGSPCRPRVRLITSSADVASLSGREPAEIEPFDDRRECRCRRTCR